MNVLELCLSRTSVNRSGNRLSRDTIQMQGSEIFPRMPTDSVATVTKGKYLFMLF